jgi:4'-phosphopantetheinyl transferase
MLLFDAKVLDESCRYKVYDASPHILGREPLPQAILDHLPADELEEAGAIFDRAERTRSILSKFILRSELSRELGIAPASLGFAKGRYGKPLLSDPVSNLRFNVSHSGNFIAIAISPTDVGIDIEKHRVIEDAEGMVYDYFCSDEHQWLIESGVENRMPSFFTLWTRKEALLKAIGTGFSTPLNRISVMDGHIIAGQWRLESIVAPQGYSAAVSWQI